jgi:hypothetical protein
MLTAPVRSLGLQCVPLWPRECFRLAATRRCMHHNGPCRGGTGTSFDGGGAGTNEPDMDVWKVYSANGTHGPAPSAPHQQVMSSESNTAERSLHAVVGTIVN